MSLTRYHIWAPRHSVDGLRFGRRRQHRPALARPERRRCGLAAADAAHRGRSAHRRARYQRRAAGARRRPRAAGGHPFERDAVTVGEAMSSRVRRSAAGNRSGARFRVRRIRRRYDDPDWSPSCARCPGRCTRCPPHRCRTPRPRRGRVRAALRGPVGRRRAGRLRAGAAGVGRRRSARPRRAGAGIRHGSTGRPTMPRRGRCGCSRTRHTSTRSSPSARA